MTETSTEQDMARKFGAHSLIIGILLMILGVVGLVLPVLMSLGTVVFISWLLIVGAILWAGHTYKYDPKSIMDWIKPALLLLSGGLMLFYPLPGIAAVGMLLAIYLLMDAFGSFVMAQSTYPAKGWGWMVFNGLTSLVLAGLFLFGWPETSMWLVGLFVSISLFFDGAALLAIGIAMRSADQDKKA